MLDQDKREELADIYSQIQQGNRKWRIRQIIASQIGLLSRLFLEETIVKIIIPISFQLCKDEVASVRETACLQVSTLLTNNHRSPLCELLITENIKSFATYNRFTLRQAFVCMCEGLLEDYAYFKANFLEAFSKLVDDRVVNVRIGLAKVLVRHFDRKTPASREEDIIRLYKQLAKDKAADVVKILKKEHTIIDEVISSSSEDHNHSRTISEDNHSEERKHETETMLEKIDQVKKEDAAHPHSKDEVDPASPLLDDEKERIPAKDAQDEIEKIVETKQVDDETPEVREAIEEAQELKKKEEERHRAQHETKAETEVEARAEAEKGSPEDDKTEASAPQEKPLDKSPEVKETEETHAEEAKPETAEDTSSKTQPPEIKPEEEKIEETKPGVTNTEESKTETTEASEIPADSKEGSPSKDQAKEEDKEEGETAQPQKPEGQAAKADE